MRAEGTSPDPPGCGRAESLAAEPAPLPEGPSTFEEFFDALYPRAWRLAKRLLGDPVAAQDTAAEALARAYAHWGRLEGLAWRDGWVLRTTANLAFRAGPRRVAEDAGQRPGPGEQEILDRLELSGALRSLPRRQREAVALHFLCDLTEADVASVLGVSIGTVKTHIHRGVKSLRARLGEEDLGHLPS